MIYLVSNNGYLFNDNMFKLITIQESLKILDSIKELSIDTETEGLDFLNDKLLLLQIGDYDNQVLYDIKSFNCLIPQPLINYLNSTDKLAVLQNAKFDLKFLFVQGVKIFNVFDTMLAETIITNGLQYSGRSLESLGIKYCEIYLDKSVRGEIISKGLSDKVLNYGAEDIKYLSVIKEKQLEKIEELGLLQAVKLDNAFVTALAYTEFCGIKLDFKQWSEKTRKNLESVRVLEKKLNELVYSDKKLQFFSGMLDMFDGSPHCLINWDSPKQVIQVFKSYDINVNLVQKGTSKESVDAKVLEPQKKDFPIIPLYLEYKEAVKEVSTYGLNWKSYINKKTGRIHTNFNQLNNTGRLSSSPNIQNLPAGEETRKCFISEKGNVLIDADYNSQEQIVLANASKEPNLLNFYSKGFTDMHSYIAFLMYEHIRRCPLEELTPEKLKYVKDEYHSLRDIAKKAGFAINKPFYLVWCLSRKLNNFVALFGNIEENHRENCGELNGQSAAELSE